MMAVAVLSDPPAPPHLPVLLDSVLDLIEPENGRLYLDVTVGRGGHASAILDAATGARLIGFDRDPAAVAASRERLSSYGTRARVVHARFSEVEQWLDSTGLGPADGLIADLGVSSAQLDDAERGLSFRSDGPIDMRLDPTDGETALELIERVSQDELADIIYHYGEERRARRVARCIKQALEQGRLQSTIELRRAVVRAVGPQRVGGIDPATRTFQALRIAVNEELAELSLLLEGAPRILKPGARAVFISFHSLEDRLVKRALLDDPRWAPLTKKPVMASDLERDANPRARSAKLRAARRADSNDTAERSSEEPA